MLFRLLRCPRAGSSGHGAAGLGAGHRGPPAASAEGWWCWGSAVVHSSPSISKSGTPGRDVAGIWAMGGNLPAGKAQPWCCGVRSARLIPVCPSAGPKQPGLRGGGPRKVSRCWTSTAAGTDPVSLTPGSSAPPCPDPCTAPPRPSPACPRHGACCPLGAVPSLLVAGGTELLPPPSPGRGQGLLRLLSHGAGANICLRSARILARGFIPARAERLQSGNSAKANYSKNVSAEGEKKK